MIQRWFDRLERRFSGWAMPQLSNFIVGMNAAIWALSLARPEFPARLTLEPALVRQGELWRVVTFLFIPPETSPLWLFFWLYLLWLYAQHLEARWGDFRFNLFYGIGAAATVLGSLAAGVPFSNVPLNATIFLAFAHLWPDFELLFFFVLPVKVKWLAWLAWAGIAWSFLVGGGLTRLALLCGLANYALFFGAEHLQSLRQGLALRRHRRRYKDAFK